jgi:glycosyltransferase involved in cell wall biosynthesis
MNKQIRILDYLHIASKNLKNDSNYLFHKFLFKYLKRHHPDKFHFYLTYPNKEENHIIMEKLKREYNFITPVPIKYYSTNAFFRNALDWESLQKNAPDYDIIFNNTPEVGFELLSYSISKGIYCNMINYAHWYPEMVNGPVFSNYLTNQNEKYCIELKYLYNFAIAYKNFNNSKYGVSRIIKGFEELPPSKWQDDVRNKTKCLYMTIDNEEIEQYKPDVLENPDIPVLVFNHRHLAYTGFSDFMNGVEKIIKIRPQMKFKIFISSGGNNDLRNKFDIPDEYYYKKDNNSFKDYINILWNCQGIQIGSHIGQNQWSLAFLDGMFCNLIPFYRKGIFFDELFEGLPDLKNYSYTTEDEFVEKLIYMIENIDFFRKNNKNIYDHFKKNWTWENFIDEWADVFLDTYEQVRTYKNSEKIKTLDIDSINFPCPWNKMKGILNISDQRPTNQYRKTLKDTYELKEDMDNTEIVLYRKDQTIRKTAGFFK